MNKIYVDEFERILGYQISQIDFNKVTDRPINYHWGGQQELSRYLINKGENAQVNNSLETDISKKIFLYPLIWLVLPNIGVKGESDWVYHRNTRIVISKNTRSDFFNQTRWSVSFEILSAIANTLLNNLNGKFFQIIKDSKGVEQIKFTKYPNYSTNSKDNKTIDVWDALAIDIDLILKTNCITKEIINYDTCREK